MMKRRTFFQKSGIVLAALGLSQAGLSLFSDRYSQALAQSSPRKLALLVGVNQYLFGTPLTGCVTDVELQRELLIHRFGFHPSDILTITDQQATRENIETAFLEHLTKQAKSGDVVVFHFSGYGSRFQKAVVQESESLEKQKQSSSVTNLLLPVDGIIQIKNQPVANALMEDTLWLLLRSLPTKLVTSVLDTSYTDGGIILQGNLRVRSRPSILTGEITTEELALQDQLKQNSEIISPDPGLVLIAAKPKQVATEGQLDGFSSGFFTYALTQHLWQATPATTVQVSLNRVAGTVAQLVGNKQQPEICAASNPQQSLLTYHVLSPEVLGADGVVIAVEEYGKTAQLWLAGLPAKVLQYSINSLFTTVKTPNLPNQVTPPLQLAIRSHEGLKAKARVNSSTVNETSKLQVGELVQEVVRVLPHNVNLTVALDSCLARIERVDATSAFSGVPHVTSIVAGEQSADCLFGRVSTTESVLARAESESVVGISLPLPKSSYGLFSPGLSPIPNTSGEAGEAVKTAVNRLVPKLQTLLAAKLLRLTANEGSSRLGVQAVLETIEPTQEVLMQRSTVRAPWPTPKVSLSSTAPKEGIAQLPISSSIQYKIHNYGDAPIYFILLGIDANGSPIALLPARSTNNLNEEGSKSFATEVIIPGETTIIPANNSPFKWVVQGPRGVVEIQLIFSRAPFSQTLATLEDAKISAFGRLTTLPNSLDVARSILEDLHQASGKMAEAIAAAPDTWVLDVNNWATLSFIYQVV
ncbi:caspase family protein [Aerosakkonemataceae cyanobacterium BLCC-F154]|uniref:Caspase family protein n=2 Tax=Floridanema TaxID=3396149 RepID=A0ABV4Y5Z8_9CYAN